MFGVNYMRRLEKLLLAAAILGCAVAAAGSETINYTYDARGRLVKVEHSGNVNNGVTTIYTYDKAGNRTNKTTTGAPK